MRRTRRVLLSTLGSSGDVFPFLSLGAELSQRGYDVTLGSHSEWQTAAEEAGLNFINIGPDFLPVGGHSAGLRRLAADPGTRLEWLRDGLLHDLENQALRAMGAVESSDLVVTHPMAFAARIAARAQKKPWVSTILEPSGFFSEFEPQVLFAPVNEFLGFFGGLGAGLQRKQNQQKLEPINRLILEVSSRMGQGLWPGEPIQEGQFSPILNLGLVSRLLAKPQADWPRHVLSCGFCHWDRGVLPADERIMDWIQSGEAPLALALGDLSSRKKDGMDAMVAEAAQIQGLRLLILDGDSAHSNGPISHSVMVAPWASLKVILPRCRALLHGGSVGLCGVALASGAPTLILPNSPAEEDHARRLVDEGCAISLSRRKASVNRLEQAIRSLDADELLRRQAMRLQKQTRYESGPVAAVDALECVMLGAETEARFPTVRHGLTRHRLRQMWEQERQDPA